MNYSNTNNNNNNNSNLNFNSNTNTNVPYGCLKNGSKPTYRDWIKTRKNYESPEINIRPPTPPKRAPEPTTQTQQNTQITSILTPSIINTSTALSREQKLDQIKKKLQKIQDNEIQSNPEAAKLDKNLKFLEGITLDVNKTPKLDVLPELDEIKMNVINVTEIIKEKKEIEENVPKEYLKRTIRKSFTLGKSDKFRKVGVLLNDKQTRKNILDVQQELKKTSMTDVRKYLRQHGIIKIGSNAPNDILRKTFEASMLTGEITNTNKDTLMHNFINSETTES